MPAIARILLGIFLGGGVGLVVGFTEAMILASSSQIRAQCPGGGACDYALGAVIAARVIVALDVAGFLTGLWLVVRGQPGLGAGVMTAIITSLLPAAACGLGYAFGGAGSG
jgi:hypothetical protein